jgi:hypothetical protein
LQGNDDVRGLRISHLKWNLPIEVVSESLCETDAAQLNRCLLENNGASSNNIIGSAGCGKTTLILDILKALEDSKRIAVITAHLTACGDATRLERQRKQSCMLTSLRVSVWSLNTCTERLSESTLLRPICS